MSGARVHNILIVLRFCVHLQLWPLVSLINYKYVPLKLRVLVMQAIAFSGKPAFLKITGRLSTFHNEALSMFHTSAAIQFCLHPGGSYKHASCFKYMTCSCYA